MRADQWILDIIAKAAKDNLGTEPQEVVLTNRRMTSSDSFPVTASVKMPDSRRIDVSLVIQGISYSDFRVIREVREGEG
ncbi:MAG: hypothetical protein NTU41_04950 [Chloroflexi bacterium]|nr:hypothetical protein [Chloroflexota bacterium]